jgi:hypothetical protein
MEYEKLTYDKITIYKTKLHNIDDAKLLEEVYANKRYLFYDSEYNDEMLHLPGLQMTGDLMTGDETTVIKKRGYDVCKSIFEAEHPKKTVYSGLQTSWFYISTPSNPISKYHDHLLFSQKERGILTHYTWIYYIQLPDNCTGKEGHIFFKDPSLIGSIGDEDAYSFFPEQGYLYMWDSEVPHRPELSPNSTLDRVIIAGNVNFNTHIK